MYTGLVNALSSAVGPNYDRNGHFSQTLLPAKCGNWGGDISPTDRVLHFHFDECTVCKHTYWKHFPRGAKFCKTHTLQHFSKRTSLRILEHNKSNESWQRTWFWLGKCLGTVTTDSPDSPDCLPILLSISVIYFLLFFCFPLFIVGSVR